MEIIPMLFVVLAFLFSILITSTTSIQDKITSSPTTSIKDGGSTLVSAGGSFELGFFSPGSSKGRYVGIWYKDISPQKVVWVCNKEAPLTDHSGALHLTSEGVLSLFNGTNGIVWSSSNKTSRNTSNSVAQLLDSGNFVVKDGSNEDSKILWQSFDYPGDTLLPGMKIGWDLRTGLNRFLSSWKGAEDPAPGQFSFSIDRSGYPQLVLMNGSIPHFRLGSWNGLGFTGSPQVRSQNQFFKLDFVSNENEVYYIYELLSTSVESRLVLQRSGDLQRFMWSGTTDINHVIYSAPVDRCDAYNFCGAFALCSDSSMSACACLHGFTNNFSTFGSKCERNTPLSCNEHGDGFKTITRVKLPDTSSSSSSWFDPTMSLGDCEKTCLKKCSCTAYANLDVKEGGTGCLLWFDKLNDIREFNTGGQDLFVKMAVSDLGDSRDTSMKKQVPLIVSIGMFVMAALTLGLAFYIRMKKSRGFVMEDESDDNGNGPSEVFLNFRGTDTREGFAKNLYDALRREKIKAFFDDEWLEKGSEIGISLFKAIEESKISVTIFSKNYVSSSWCLNELLKIRQCRESKQQVVIPVFYKVEPKEVRYQTGAFFLSELKHSRNTDKIPHWKAALKEAGGLSGFPYQSGYESQMIEGIVKNISDKLKVLRYLDQFDTKCPPDGGNQIIIYTTSSDKDKTMQICESVIKSLTQFNQKLCQRDISDPKFRKELKDLTKKERTPALFVNGKYVGGYDVVNKLINKEPLFREALKMYPIPRTDVVDSQGGVDLLQQNEAGTVSVPETNIDGRGGSPVLGISQCE